MSHTHIIGYYTAIKMNKILPFVTMWMDLKGIMLSEIITWKKTNTKSMWKFC